MWIQKEIQLTAKSRGFHLVTNEILQQVPDLEDVNIGMMNVFLKHTSASLTINENADPTVRQDFEAYFGRIAPEKQDYYIHTHEGDDDLPAHFKSSILGNSLNIPIANGSLNMGTWQGIYLGEHRNHGGSRRLVITINGE